MKIRRVTGSYDESMSSVQDIGNTVDSIVVYVRSHNEFANIDPTTIDFTWTGNDKRNGWSTYMVSFNGLPYAYVDDASQLEAMTFSEAIEKMKAGHSIRRVDWFNYGWVKECYYDQDISDEKVAVKDIDGRRVPYSFSYPDINSNKWIYK